MCKNYILVDLFSGSYLDENTGHEIFNDKRNPVTGKYLGYLPPHDNPNIAHLGASTRDDYIDGIRVVFVQRVSEKSIDRRVTGFYPNARVYRKKQSGEGLGRSFSDKDKSTKIASYTLESDTYHSIESEYGLIIETSKYSPHMFRKQRVYGGRYPELDPIITNYLDQVISGELFEDDIIAQQVLQEIPEATEKVILNAPKRELLLDQQSSGEKVKRNPNLVKSAVVDAGYQCEVDGGHVTFLNRHDRPYMEGHHLIPCTAEIATDIWDNFTRNIDCKENIVSLCPNCHRAIHLGNQEVKQKILSVLLEKRLPILNDIGIAVDENYLLSLYGIE
ncbi:hypothetical protein GX865_05755 [Candidatus Saccharibacteria bacterium]|nr:hypothetical protein [Candidatus Saccharibacteria bacterium]